MSKIFGYLVLILIVSCGFQAKRVNDAESDERALEITDKWLIKDTENSVSKIMGKMQTHKSLKKYMRKFKSSQPKIFVADVQNKTDSSDFPIEDFNDELLTRLSETGDFILIDNQAREAILKEITYQHDGMVTPGDVKKIGKQSGADLLIFGNINMKTRKRDGKAIKQYSVNIRITELERAIELFRARHKVHKYSDKSSFGL